MSDGSEKTVLSPPGGPPKKRPPLPRHSSAVPPTDAPLLPELAMRKQAPGVKNSKEAPEVVTLKTGDSIGGRFQVERYLGSSGGGVSYLCRDKKTDDSVVVKVLDMPFPGNEAFKELSREISLASSLTHKNLTSAVGMGKTRSGEIFVAMEFVEGSTLSQLVARRREEGRTLSLRDAFTVLAHTANALEQVHSRKLSHGVLTPYNIYVNHEGRVKVGNLGFGRMVSTYLHELGEGPFVDSIYVAPEVVQDPGRLSPASDVYSLGMIAAELLSPMGLPSNRRDAHAVAVDVVSSYTPALFSLVTSCLSNDVGGRPGNVAQFRDEFEEIVRDAGEILSGAPPPGALPVEPAVEDEGTEDAFDLFNLGEIGDVRQESEDRFLVQKSGLDYGPFTAEQILEQLYADEIHEGSLVLDRITQERRELESFEVFRDDVLAYIPVREERLRREAEARAELQRRVKQGGVAALVIGIVGGIIVLLAMGWFWLQQPSPEPLPLESAFASMDYQFSPPPTEFQQVAVDSAVMESIFNPNASEEEVARQVARVRRNSRAAAALAPTQTGGGEEEIYVVEMGADVGATRHLTDQEINQVIMADFAAMRECIMREVRENRSFRGVTVRFFIRPSGTTGGVGLKETSYESRPVGQCLIQRFQFLKFPEHGAITNRGVEFPILLQ